MHWNTVFATLLAVLFSRALAHVPFFEPQLFDASPEGDWTMQNPFIIPTDAAVGFSPSLNNSRAITSVLGLTPKDTYDVATFEITTPQVIIGLQALAANCPTEAPLSSATFYPSIALLGPTIDPNFAESNTKINQSTPDTLPFPIPDGYGAIIRNQPRVPLTERGIYSAGPFVSYLLPYPVTPDCITTEQAFARCANGTAAETSIITDVKLSRGKYYIVWWNPEYKNTTTATQSDSRITTSSSGSGTIQNEPREVTVSFGVGEEATPREQQLQMEVMTGQNVPAFNPCTGSFTAPPVVVGEGASAAMSPGME